MKRVRHVIEHARAVSDVERTGLVRDPIAGDVSLHAAISGYAERLATFMKQLPPIMTGRHDVDHRRLGGAIQHGDGYRLVDRVPEPPDVGKRPIRNQLGNPAVFLMGKGIVHGTLIPSFHRIHLFASMTGCRSSTTEPDVTTSPGPNPKSGRRPGLAGPGLSRVRTLMSRFLRTPERKVISSRSAGSGRRGAPSSLPANAARLRCYAPSSRERTKGIVIRRWAASECRSRRSRRESRWRASRRSRLTR